jgi:GH24 family phage-related lysozyme (muramidase)
MAGFRIPGPLNAVDAAPLDAGTSARWWMAEPGPVCRLPPVRRWVRYSRAGGFAASALTMSPEAVALLKAIEVLHLKPYDDQTGKAISAWVAGATIGYGHLIAKAEWATYKDGITAEAADALFVADAKPFETAVGEAITVGVQQHEFDAMVILAYNIGARGFRNSSVAKLVNDPKAVTGHASLEAAWKSWNKSQGKVMKGLDNRRAAEWRIFTSAIYERW